MAKKASTVSLDSLMSHTLAYLQCSTNGVSALPKHLNTPADNGRQRPASSGNLPPELHTNRQLQHGAVRDEIRLFQVLLCEPSWWCTAQCVRGAAQSEDQSAVLRQEEK